MSRPNEITQLDCLRSIAVSLEVIADVSILGADMPEKLKADMGKCLFSASVREDEHEATK